jgi:exodeoxyribonuclease V gamma subunit
MKPGLLVLQGNRIETLAELVFAWLGRHPLSPLEEEAILVQSNGMAEWFKMNLAQAHGVCAATRVELPARFLWRLYRATLGRAAVPPVLPGDKVPLLWRLMALLPSWLEAGRADPRWRSLIELCEGHEQPSDGPLAELRLYHLCSRIADVFDQYQVYRPDWLRDWAEGRDVLRGAPLACAASSQPMPAALSWQPVLWRSVMSSLSTTEQACLRPTLHARCLALLRDSAATPDRLWPEVPRRVVLFGSTPLPYASLELLAALSRHIQVVMAVPNPCRYFWADLIEGREQLTLNRRRQPSRQPMDMAALPLPVLQGHGHPLLSAWGRQSRDFVRQLDAFDDAQRSRDHFELPRIDVFDDDLGTSLLRQIQDRIRDGVPLAEHAEQRPPPTDGSVRFQIAHSVRREVEVLHDQLLQLLANPPEGTPLAPKDIVVMVPDIDRFAPSIRAVFGQYTRGDARFIPWGMADSQASRQSPLIQAVDWLLGIRQHRCGAEDWRDLLELPCCASRFGLSQDQVPQALTWLKEAGVRWGLHGEQREALGLQAAGEVNTWRFGVRRMLLGFAAGDLDKGFAGEEPFDEVSGLAAELAGGLSQMVTTLDRWWRDADRVMPPALWAERLQALMMDMFVLSDELDRAAMSSLQEALSQWLQGCESGGFDAPVSLGVVRQAWWNALSEPGFNQRFKAGGVTFCTLLPLRAVPFEVVCLVGMNHDDYPRTAAPSDFDLMGLPGLGRPGDRSRRHDDRQLMLDAVLSARRVLLISWTGRSQRDNTVQPPSVLVAQLRDYIDAAWGAGVCAERTVEHPLQPFSRRYFEQGEDGCADLFTYAVEWRQAHDGLTPAAAHTADVGQPDEETFETRVFDLKQLCAFVRHPVRFYYRHRLAVEFDDDDAGLMEQDESFSEGGLHRIRWLRELLVQQQSRSLDDALEKLAREGRLPLAGPGQLAVERLRDTVAPMLLEGERLARLADEPAPLDISIGVSEEGPAVVVQDVLTDVHGDPSGALFHWAYVPRGLCHPSGVVRDDRVIDLWVRTLVCSAAGRPVHGVAIGTDAIVDVHPIDSDAARDLVQRLLLLVAESFGARQVGRPLATALMTGLAWLRALEASDGDAHRAAAAAEAVYEGGGHHAFPEVREACLRRTFPTFEDLAKDPHFVDDTRRLYGHVLELMHDQVKVRPLPAAAQEVKRD